MPASQSKITFDAINIVKAENIYLNNAKRERNVKRKCSVADDLLINQHKKLVPELDLKQKKLKNTKIENSENHHRSKNIAPAVIAAKKSRKRQIDIGNAYSKLNSQRQNQPKTSLDSPKSVSDSQSSFYLTPRQNIIEISENDYQENIKPSHESELDDFIRTQYPDFEDPSQYNFEHPLVLENFDLPQETFKPEHGLRHFKKLLDQEDSSSKNKLLEKSEIDLLRDIVKADERYQKLKRDDYQLIKEILMGQLKEVSEQERVIKVALEKIQVRKDFEVKVDSLKVRQAEQPLENVIEKRKTSLPKQQEVDVFFKNVPSLEREIKILKQLGLKLEETLQKTSETKEKNLPTPVVLYSIEKVGFSHSIHQASSQVYPRASITVVGFAQEYKISHQTIDELKLERDFYIATDFNNFTLQRTNFNLLRHNPELLLRRLKPITKDSRLRFNIIEQDPMFFNHFLASICNISPRSFEGHKTYIPKNCIPKEKPINNSPVVVRNDAGGDYADLTMKYEEIPELDLTKNVSEKKSSQISIGKHRKPKQVKFRTPLEEKKFVSAKNRFLKIILLGSLHLSIVLMVVTAIFYSDVICL